MTENTARKGFDSSAALAQLKDRRALLTHSLKSFRQQFSDASGAIQRYLAQNDRTSAARIAHTVKGSSLQICAGDLSKLAASLEKSIKAGNAEMNPILAQFGKELDLTLSEIEVYLDNEVISAPPSPLTGVHQLHGDELKKSLDKMIGYLDAGDMRALKNWEILKHSVSYDVPEQLIEDLEARLSRLDFDGAALIMRKIVTDFTQ